MKSSTGLVGAHHRMHLNAPHAPATPPRTNDDGALWRAIVDLPHSLYEQDLLRLPGQRAEWQRIVHP